MNTITPKVKISDTVQLLSKNGIRPSIQRLAVYRYLAENDIHPTADALYLALAPSIPTLSKTTVYNTLKLLEKKHLVRSIAIENDELRYDADISDHWHFKCTKCGNVYDIFSKDTEKTKESALKALPEHFVPQKIEMYMWGLCAHCSRV